MLDKIKNTFVYREYLKHQNFINYSIIGVLGTILDLLVFASLIYLLPTHYLFANIVSSQVGMAHNFVLNSILNFKKFDRKIARFVSFYLVAIILFINSSIILYIGVDILLAHKMIVKAFAVIFNLVLGFVLNKKFSFSNN